MSVGADEKESELSILEEVKDPWKRKNQLEREG
jgi:hypothetical protein